MNFDENSEKSSSSSPKQSNYEFRFTFKNLIEKATTSENSIHLISLCAIKNKFYHETITQIFEEFIENKPLKRMPFLFVIDRILNEFLKINYSFDLDFYKVINFVCDGSDANFLQIAKIVLNWKTRKILVNQELLAFIEQFLDEKTGSSKKETKVDLLKKIEEDRDLVILLAYYYY